MRSRLCVRHSLILLTLALTASSAVARCASGKPPLPRWADSISLAAERDLEPELLREAVALWAGCGNYGDGFPELVPDGESPFRLEIQRETMSPGRTCARLVGRTITLFDFAKIGGSRSVHCGSLAQNLAHEIGHFLGLRDAPRKSDCSRSIMAPLSPDNRASRSVGAPECQVVGQRWLTSDELATLSRVGLEKLSGWVVSDEL